MMLATLTRTTDTRETALDSEISSSGRRPEHRPVNMRSMAARRITTGPTGGMRLRLPKIRPFDLALPLALPAFVLIAWESTAANGWLPPQILPPPAMVLATLIDLIRSGEIAANLEISLWRMTTGFVLGAALGLAFGTGLGVSKRLDQHFGPLLKALAQVPSLGWVPILILIFGLDEILKVVIIAKACFVPIALATAQGVRNIPKPYRDVGRVLRLSRRTLLLKLIVPAALPTVFGGMRLALSHAWIALIVVEMLAAQEGIGYMMVWGRTLFQIDVVIAGMLVIAVIGLAMDCGLRRAERQLRRWVPDHG
jgi:sulfonate transport system permease protein